jgi:uncharacterized BrkB/YihY/UPF0761 family membrane protein
VSAVELLPGALLIGVGVQFLHLATVFYFAHRIARASKLYGGLGGAATILLWTYLVARLVIASTVVNKTLAGRRAQRTG